MQVQKNKKKSILKYKMDFIEKITLSPIEKYTRFNRFPWKLLLHILLLIFTTLQVLSVVGTRTANSRSMHQVFKNLLLNSTDEIDKVNFNSFQSFQDHLVNMTQILQNLNQQIFQDVDMNNSNFKIALYYIELGQTKNISEYPFFIQGGFPKKAVDIYNLTSLKMLINNISQMTLTGNNITMMMAYGDIENSYFCSNWSIKIDYNFETFARIIANFDSSNTFCTVSSSIGVADNFGQSYLLLHFAVLILASISLFLSWKSIYQMAKDYMQYMFLYQNVKNYVGKSNSTFNKAPSLQSHSSFDNDEENHEPFENLLEFKKSWEELSFFDKLKFFDFWFVFSIFGNFIQINGSIIAILFVLVQDQLSIFTFHEAIIGFGCMFAWLLMLKYLEYNPNINLMTSTLSKSGSTLAIFLLGVLPFYLAYVFLGQCLFWKTDKFQDTNMSVITLFSLSFGDVVNETFQNTKIAGVLGEIFLMTFMLLFYTAVQNVFITIIMDGYEKSRREKKGKGVDKTNSPKKQRPSNVPPAIFVRPSENNNQKNEIKEKKPLITESFVIKEEDKLFGSSKIKEDDLDDLFKKDKEDEAEEKKNEEKKNEDLNFEIEKEEEESKGIEPTSSDKSGRDSKKIFSQGDSGNFNKEVEKLIGKKDDIVSPIKKPKNDKDKILNKLKTHVSKIEKILENLEKIANDIETIEFTPDDKMFLINNYKESLEDIEKEVKYQIIPAIACDIDGVLVRGYRKSIPNSIPALNLIRKGLNELFPNIFPEKTTIQLPFVCLTNSGGCLEIDKANYINEILQLKNEFLSKHIILNFTPFRKLLEDINNDPILIMGSGNVESIVQDCKVKNYLFWDEYRFLDQNSELNKNLKITKKLEKRFSNNLYNPIFHSSLLDIKSIFILHDPYEWENQIAAILSILKKNNSKTINIYSSANDALYSDCFPLSRFGIGSFNASLKHIYYKQFRRELNIIYSGKPTSMTFDYAKNQLNKLSEFPISNYYMIGDNPKVDIIGGKQAGFKTILVKTGVYKQGDETEDPDFLVEDFNEAIKIIIKQENLTLK